MNYYEHHLGDYLRDTAHLSMIEAGYPIKTTLVRRGGARVAEYRL